MFARDSLQFRTCDQPRKPHDPVIPKVLIPDMGDHNLYGRILKAGQGDLVVGVHLQLRSCTTHFYECPQQIAVGTQQTDPSDTEGTDFTFPHTERLSSA